MCENQENYNVILELEKMNSLANCQNDICLNCNSFTQNVFNENDDLLEFWLLSIFWYIIVNFPVNHSVWLLVLMHDDLVSEPDQDVYDSLNQKR